MNQNIGKDIRDVANKIAKDIVENSPITKPMITRDTPWRCVNCKNLLGYVKEGKEVRIKYKDLFVTVSKGDVTVLCRRCGEANSLKYEEDLKF